MKKFILFILTIIGLGIVGLTVARPVQASCSGTLIQVISRDVNGTLLPAVHFVIHRQLTDPDGDPYLGSSIKSGVTDSHGLASYCTTVSAPYAVNFYEHNRTYGNRVIWYDSMTINGDTVVAEARISYLQVIIRDANGTLLKNVHFDIYIQDYDADGNPIIGEDRINQAELVSSSYTTGAAGVERAYLGAGKYVVRIHGTGTKYFFLWEQDIRNSRSTGVTYRLGTLRVELLDGLGALLKNRTFSLYEQDFDARGSPIYGELIAANLQIGSTGKYDAYLPEGTYALKIPSSIASMTYSSWKIRTQRHTLTTRTFQMSGLRVIINENGELKKNARFHIGIQGTDANGAPAVADDIYSSTTGELGYKDVFLKPGRYALIYGTNRVYFLDVFASNFTTVNWPINTTVRPKNGVALTNPIANQLTIKRTTNANLRSLTTVRKRIGYTYAVAIRSIARRYRVSFTYKTADLQALGVSPSKLRIAYYNSQLKRWALVGTLNTSRKQISIQALSRGTFTLVAIR